jgi:hypothetical protein
MAILRANGRWLGKITPPQDTVHRFGMGIKSQLGRVEWRQEDLKKLVAELERKVK